MTGRDLIIYILEHNLENEEIYCNGNIVGFITDEQAAAKWEVGVETVRAWVTLKILDGVYVEDHLYIPALSFPRLPNQ